MPTDDQSEPADWSCPDDGFSSRPYGLPYFHGEKVSVSFGWLDSSMWGEHSSHRVRLLFTFGQTFGLIETVGVGGINGPMWILRPHQFGVILPGVVTTLDWVEPADLVVLYVEPAVVGQCEFFPFGYVGLDFLALARRDPCLAQLAKIFSTLCRQGERPEPDFVEGIGLALASRTLAQRLLPSASSPKSRSGLPLEIADQVTKHIDANLGDGVLARDLARRVGLSPDHFARRFKITVGMSPKRFMLTRRMEKVRELLGTGRYNVTEAGRAVGFHDLSHLNRCFRNVFGCSPKAVLKNALAADSSQ